MDEFAPKNVCLAAAQCLCALACCVLGWVRSRRGRHGGRGLGTAAGRAARLLQGSGWEVMGTWELLVAWLSLLSSALPGRALALPAAMLLFHILLVSFLCFLASQTLFWRGRESGASERDLSRWGKRRLVLKVCLPLSNSQRSSKALPVSMKELAWDAGSRRMLSDPKVLSCKAVHGNVCMSAWRGPKHKNILLVLQGKAHHHTQPSLELCANS